METTTYFKRTAVAFIPVSVATSGSNPDDKNSDNLLGYSPDMCDSN